MPAANRLRRQFKFEVRADTGELKGLGELLDELWVKFQGMSDLERQTLLAKIGGKTQASRLTEMFNSYVQGMVLAINAQLHLNSAQEENKKIVATLAAQLQGLVSEFERFARIQGAGPMRLMREAAEGMRNFLAVLNLPGVKQATTLMAGLMTVLSARLLVTGLRLAGGGQAGGLMGFAANTRERMRGAALGLANTMEGAVDQFMGSRRGLGLMGPRRLGAATLTGRAVTRMGAWQARLSDVADRWSARGATLRQALDEYPELFVQRSRAATVAARAWALGLAGVSRTGSLVARSLVGMLLVTRATIVAVRSLLMTVAVPALAITAAIWAFNRAMEAMGLSSQKANEKVAGLNAQAEAAGAASRAAAGSVRLLGTALGALQQPGVSAKKIIEDLSKLETLSAGQRERLEATKGDRAKAREAVAQVKREMQDEMVSRMEERAAKKRQAVEANRAEQARVRQMIEHTERASPGVMYGPSYPRAEERADPFGIQERRRKNVVELQQKENELVEDYDASLGEIEETWERLLNEDTKHLAVLERRKALLQAVAELMNSLPAGGRVDQGINEMAGLMVGLEAVEASRRRVGSELADLEARGETKGLRFQSLQKQDLELVRQRRELTVQMEGLAARMPLLAQQDRWNAVLSRARGETGVFEVGESQAEKLLNKRLGIEAVIQRQQQLAARARDGSPENARLRLVAALEAKERVLLDIDAQRLELEKERNQILIDSLKEYQRGLLTAGPAEMLRKVAAWQVVSRSGGRVTAGQFFAASPALREELQHLGQFNPALIENARARRMLGPRPTDRLVLAELGAVSEQAGLARMTVAHGYARHGLPELIDQQAVATAELGRLAASAALAAGNLRALAAAVPQPTASLGGQFGGSGGAAGW